MPVPAALPTGARTGAAAAAASAAHAHTRARARRATRIHNYERHRPEQTVLYQLVEPHWPAFRERSEAAGGLPRFVVREMEEYLRCGRLPAARVRRVRLRAAGRLELQAPRICGVMEYAEQRERQALGGARARRQLRIFV
jgi:hypothetical protein